VSSPENDDLHLDLTFTAHDNQKLFLGVAAGVAAVLIIGILATMTTDVAARMLPMNDEYLQALLPRAADGKQPLALKELAQTIVENTLSVRGSVMNRTDFPVSGLLAVITATDVKYGKKVLEVPLDPPEIPTQEVAKFQADLVLDAAPSIYSVEFRIPDGPIVPHLDDRALTPVTPEMSPPVVTPKK
jgi:hypothetical protein